MNRIIFPLISLLFAAAGVHAQNKTLGVGTTTPNANAALHVESPTNNQGVIIPRLSTAQRSSFTGSLTASDIGLIVFDTDLRSLAIWDGSTWTFGSKVGEPITATSNSAAGNAGTFTISNASNNDVAINATTTGTGHAAYIENINPANANAALFVGTNGSGNAITANGTIQASSFVGDGSALTGIPGFTLPYSQNIASPGSLFSLANSGTGLTSILEITNPANANVALAASTNGTGGTADFSINNVGNSSPVVSITTNGTGPAISANAPIQATSFIGDGSGLTNIPSGGWGFSGNGGTIPGTDFIGTTDKADLVFKTDNVEALRLGTDGNLQLTAIASTSRSFKVSDATPDNNGGNLTIQAGSAVVSGQGVGGGNLVLRAGNSWNGGGTGESGKVQIIAGVNTLSNDNLKGIEFFTGEDGFDNPIERMRIDADGNVGIGTSTPAVKLDVVGEIKITDGTEGAGKVLVSDANGKASWGNASGSSSTTVTISPGMIETEGFLGGTGRATVSSSSVRAISMPEVANATLRTTIPLPSSYAGGPITATINYTSSTTSGDFQLRFYTAGFPVGADVSANVGSTTNPILPAVSFPYALNSFDYALTSIDTNARIITIQIDRWGTIDAADTSTDDFLLLGIVLSYTP